MAKIFAFLFLLVLFFSPVIWAQSDSGFRGQNMYGSTGLFSIPSGRVGWGDGNVGLDFGYRAIMNRDAGVTHIPALNLSLFRFMEISAAFDIQPLISKQENSDLLLGVKFGFPVKSTTFAAGANIQLLNLGNDEHNYYAYQPYVAITYAGSFFTMSAETTLVIGKTFYSHGPENNSSIDFGMGFDVILFPDVFGNFVHLIIDFANFGYSDNSWPNTRLQHTDAVWRGILNAGFRIDLSGISIFNNFKFLIDLIFNDLFDDGSRSFTAGAVFGFKL